MLVQPAQRKAPIMPAQSAPVWELPSAVVAVEKVPAVTLNLGDLFYWPEQVRDLGEGLVVPRPKQTPTRVDLLEHSRRGTRVDVNKAAACSRLVQVLRVQHVIKAVD